MTRISLAEAYDNRDVIAQLVRLRDDVDELLAILKDINPSGDLTNIVTKTGDQTIDGEKTFIGKIIADCDIIQNGAAYETHAEQIFSHNDYMVMRDGAVNGLPAGSYSGLQIKKYNGSDDCRMVVDNTGMMRVGKINNEQPLLTREEAANINNGALLKWDAVNKKAVDEGTVGSDFKPIKIVNGVATPVTTDLVSVSGTQTIAGTKVFSNNLNIEKNQPRVVIKDSANNIGGGTITAGDRGFLQLVDTDGTLIADLLFKIDASGRGSIGARVRNQDGTNTAVVLASGV